MCVCVISATSENFCVERTPSSSPPPTGSEPVANWEGAPVTNSWGTSSSSDLVRWNLVSARKRGRSAADSVEEEEGGKERRKRDENLNDETRPAAVVLVRLLMIVIAPREKSQAQQFVCYFLYLFSVFFFAREVMDDHSQTV